MSDDPLEPHRIEFSILADLRRIKESPEMEKFQNGLAYKSEFTKEVDLSLMNLLLTRLEKYAKGWIMANALRTSELWNKSLLLDELMTDFNNDSKAVLSELEKLEKLLKK